jgi:carbonic anhydrase
MADHGHTNGNGCCSPNQPKNIAKVLAANRDWAARMVREDPQFFKALEGQQSPEFLWIGCSDSRVPANQILGLAPGEIFVQRNLGNQVLHNDMNVMSCVEYAVTALKVNTIIVCGHYNCGAVKASLTLPTATPGVVNCWISDIRNTRNQAEAELHGLSDDEQLSRLCELNVLRQVFSVATSPVVAAAWEKGQPLNVFGMIYSLADGKLKQLAGPINGQQSYKHNLQEFMAAGIKFERCPTTKALRATTPDGNKRNTTEEIEAGLNNVQLQDRINRHANWNGPRDSPIDMAPGKTMATATA